MEENINLISANELPPAEGEQVEVLCLEGGKLKRKAADGLGGEKTDLVLKLVMPFHFNNPSAELTTVTIESGSLENVAAALKAGRPPVVKVHHLFDYTKVASLEVPIREGGVCECAVLHYGDYIHFMFTIPGSKPATVKITMAPDDPEYLEVWMYPLTRTTLQVI